MTEKNEKFPNGVEAVVLMVALMLVEYFVSAVLFDYRGAIGLDPLDTDGMVLVIAYGIIFTAVMEYKGMTYRELFHSSASVSEGWPLIMPAVALTVPALVGLIAVLVAMVAKAFPLSAGEVAMFKEMSSGSFGSIVIACLLAPVLEEMLFRGVILRSFLKQYAGWVAILGSAIIFGVAHMNIYQFVVGLVLGSVLGLLYQRSRSLLPCIFLHIAYNSMLTALTHRGLPVEGTGPGAGPDYLGIALACMLLCAMGLAVLRGVLPPAERRDS
jgi:uncharacterized protein